jgi:hypothetical protein
LFFFLCFLRDATDVVERQPSTPLGNGRIERLGSLHTFVTRARAGATQRCKNGATLRPTAESSESL